MISTPTLITPRLILRRYLLNDAEDMFVRWTSDPAAARFWTWQPHQSADETRKIVSEWIRQYDNPAYFHWLIADARDNRPLGYIYLTDLTDTDASVHYLICRACQNQGLATEALRSVTDFALNDLRLRTLHSYHHIENPASGRVLQKNGFIRTRSNETYHYYRKEKR